MTRRRWLNAVVGSFLILLIAAGSVLTPGVRHTHHGGDHAHSHSLSHAHPHDHGHGGHHHPHPHRSDAATEIHAVASHVHISFFGFEWVLPDFSDAHVTQVADQTFAYPSQAVSGDTTEVGPSFTLAQWLNFLFLFGGPLPDPTRLIPYGGSSFLTDPEIGWASRLRDAPTVPPPEFSGLPSFVA